MSSQQFLFVLIKLICTRVCVGGGGGGGGGTPPLYLEQC